MSDWSQEIDREERAHPPVHPGEVLREEWLASLEMNANQLANALGTNCQNVYDIVNERRGVSAEMALGLARWSGMHPGLWLGLQEHYDLETVRIESSERIEREIRPLKTG